METLTCLTCGKAWPDNYCPECAHTIDPSRTELPPKVAAPAGDPLTLQALRSLSQPVAQLPPAVPPLLPGADGARPTVVTLYRIWCGLILIVYVALGINEALVLAGKATPRLGPITEFFSNDDPKLHAKLLEEERQNSIVGLALALIGATIFAVGMVYCPRAQWAWVWGIVAVIVSVFPLCVSLGGAIPLLIYWLKPETKRYFRMK
jgi:hypothetical protein